jgi:Zn-dependent peptidase ImmA (M78 family)/transcriptional regulator with XRE-family HTH domain
MAPDGGKRGSDAAPEEDESTLGERIRRVRERVGLQSQELAEHIGIDPSAMSNIERGKRAVKTAELVLIARALGVSPLALVSEGSLLGRLPVAPRAQPQVGSDGSAIERLTSLAELHELLADSGIDATPILADVPSVDVAHWLSSANGLASWATAFLAMPPKPRDRFSDLIEVIEAKLRVDVLVDDSPDAIAGASITDPGFPLILVNRDQPLTRALFTLAHELGHVLSGEGEEALTLDVELSAHTNRERFANAFAAAFLMPAEQIHVIIQEHGRSAIALGMMMLDFAVSFESLIYRLHNLGLINARGRDELKLLGWAGLVAALDDDVMRTTLLRGPATMPKRHPPGLLTLRAYRGYQKGIVSVRPLAGLLGVPAEELLGWLANEQEGIDAVNAIYAAEPDASDDIRYGGDPV